MSRRIPELLKTKDFAALSQLMQERFDLEASQASLEYIRYLALDHPRAVAGGSPEDPWSDSSWLVWLKNRVIELKERDPADLLAELNASQVETPRCESDWRSLLERLSAAVLSDENVDLPEHARQAKWLGRAPASESSIAAVEQRLGRRLPSSLRQFYSVTDGWPVSSWDCFNMSAVEELGWLPDRAPMLYGIVAELQGTFLPFPDDPGAVTQSAFLDEQCTRVLRSLVIGDGADDNTLLLDPGCDPHDKEWPAGVWSSNSAMSWSADSFAELARQAIEAYLQRRLGD
jgi:hypothetical protein